MMSREDEQISQLVSCLYGVGTEAAQGLDKSALTRVYQEKSEAHWSFLPSERTPQTD